MPPAGRCRPPAVLFGVGHWRLSAREVYDSIWIGRVMPLRRTTIQFMIGGFAAFFVVIWLMIAWIF